MFQGSKCIHVLVDDVTVTDTVLVAELNEVGSPAQPVVKYNYIICIRHRWEGEWADLNTSHLRRGLDVVTSAEISPSRCTHMYIYSRTNIYRKRRNQTEQ